MLTHEGNGNLLATISTQDGIIQNAVVTLDSLAQRATLATEAVEAFCCHVFRH